MEKKSFNDKVDSATRWSAGTQIIAKLVSPLSNMVLARLLTPEAFGVVATVTMITSFADMLTDAGFQKYLIQHEFDSEEEKREHTNVAFWANLSISLFIWGVIALFQNQFAALVGNPGLGHVLVVACISLPLTSFSSIQMALYKRTLDFRTLFLVRLVSICIPLVITVPVALITRDYWALIIGMIVTNLSNAVILTWHSPWRPQLAFSFFTLKKMLSFSMWTMFEQFTIWLTNYIGTFIVSTHLTTYYLGLYKTSITTVNQFTTLLTTAITPILFASLSRMQNEKNEFRKIFFKFQRFVAAIAVPLCVGLFLYRDFATQLLLGSQWGEATNFIGIWSLSGAVVVVGLQSSEVYRAVGNPRLSSFVQIIYLLLTIPVLYTSSFQGYEAVCIAQTSMRPLLIVLHLIILRCKFGFKIVELIRNVAPCYVAVLVMSVVALLLQLVSADMIWSFASVMICVVVYFSVLFAFRKYRSEIYGAFLQPFVIKHSRRLKRG